MSAQYFFKEFWHGMLNSKLSSFFKNQNHLHAAKKITVFKHFCRENTSRDQMAFQRDKTSQKGSNIDDKPVSKHVDGTFLNCDDKW